MFAISFDTSSSTYRPSHPHSPSAPTIPSHSLIPRLNQPTMDTSVQPFNTGGPNSPGAPPEYPSISLDTEMMDEDEMMAMGETIGPGDYTLETPIDGQQSADTAPDGVIANKIHLRGLDNMSSADVKAFVGAYFPDPEVEKLEWIDDTSLNLVYRDEETAAAALTALSTEFGATTARKLWELREAKRSEAFPLVRLDVRLAFTTDKKERGARERSRYYLFHPEEDRVEQQEKKKREHDRGGRDRRGEYRQRDYDERRYRSGSRERDRDDRRRSRSQHDNEDRRREPIELFPGGGSTDRRPGRRSRSRSPVELFPSKVKNANVELFPESASAKADGMELFPDKVKSTSVELFPGKNERKREGDTPPRTLFSIDDPVEMSRRGQSPQRQRRERERERDRPRDGGRAIELFPESKSRSLADRIDNPRGGSRNRNDDMEMGDSETGLSIRGSAGGGGISIRGAAKGQAGHSNAGIELLPDKAANSLFNRISEPGANRRGARRQKAEDMFS
ncbi:hypothetical protein H072_7520 [Dactylellina haptotyla CBS 200.50]|uniref:Uncharacterized protein n=1 Tax=Dactylellina haptotyla (strain CBS 200.50) TaxID=1284197 RepID=S8AC98_DACHA|nr:hypothetical protein H072_7520 [Dactylellina haptotyla CBS 200.50]